MSRIEELLKEEAQVAEDAEKFADPLAALPDHVIVTRGTARTRNLQVRFSDDEFEQLASYSASRGLPISTVVRLLVLREIAPVDTLESALNRLETDLAALRRTALDA